MISTYMSKVRYIFNSCSDDKKTRIQIRLSEKETKENRKEKKIVAEVNESAGLLRYNHHFNAVVTICQMKQRDNRVNKSKSDHIDIGCCIDEKRRKQKKFSKSVINLHIVRFRHL